MTVASTPRSSAIFSNQPHTGWFVAFPEGNGRQEGTVGLDEEAVLRHRGRHLSHRRCVLECHDARNGDEPITGHDLAHRRFVTGEAMVDDARTGPRIFLVEDGHRLPLAIAVVNDDGLPNSLAARICLRNTSRCTSRGELS